MVSQADQGFIGHFRVLILLRLRFWSIREKETGFFLSAKLAKISENTALEDGAVKLLYPDQPIHPRQKYRLTEAAKEWKNNA